MKIIKWKIKTAATNSNKQDMKEMDDFSKKLKKSFR